MKFNKPIVAMSLLCGLGSIMILEASEVLAYVHACKGLYYRITTVDDGAAEGNSAHKFVRSTRPDESRQGLWNGLL